MHLAVPLVAHLAAIAVTVACPANLAQKVDAPAWARQLITVEAPTARSTYATLRTWKRQGRCWTAAGPARSARVGWNGVRENRREGDGTTPAGTFAIHGTMYGVAPDPGVRFRYVRIRCGDWWNEDSRSPTYNSFQRVGCGVRPPFSTGSDAMWQDPAAYAHFAVVEYNMRPVVAGRGSGIFLHARKAGPTNGCISVYRPELVRVLRWLRPADRPHIAIGTRAQLTGS